MSAYASLATPMTDQDCLLKALSDLGFPARKVEVHASPVPLVGYKGDTRTEVAHVVIRRKHVGRLSNDIGFQLTETGYRARISDWDSNRYGSAWMAKLQMLYAAHNAAAQRSRAQAGSAQGAGSRQVVEAQRREVLEKARRLGYRVDESREGNGFRLVLTKSSY